MNGRLSAIALAVMALCGACGPATTSGTRTGSAVPFALSFLRPTLARCPAERPLRDLPVVARPAVAPDDLTVDGAGHIWVSGTAAGVIMEISRSGARLRTYQDPHLPEGLAVIGGRIAVAEQGLGTNRVRVLDPATGSISPLTPVTSTTAYGGVDGIAVDRPDHRLLIPDSADGSLLSVGLDGSDKRVLATGLGRPVGAAGGASTVYVAAESDAGLVVVRANGIVHRLGTLSNLDDVVSEGGLLYVTDLTHETVDAVDPTSGAKRVLVTGVAQPQGIASDGAGRLLVSDSASGVVARVTGC